MGVMFDAVVWENLRGKVGAKAGYIDGSVSEWPAEAWTEFQSDPLLRITTLADPAGECFDYESRNAGIDQVIAGIRDRLARREWSVLYVGGDGWSIARPALAAAGLAVTDAKYWPMPYLYLGCADPTGIPHARPAWAPVNPVFCQWGWFGDYDQSETYGTFPGVPGPTPLPPGPVPPVIDQEDALRIINDGTGQYFVAGARIMPLTPEQFQGAEAESKLDDTHPKPVTVELLKYLSALP